MARVIATSIVISLLLSFYFKANAQIHTIYALDGKECCTRISKVNRMFIEDFSYSSYDLIYQEAFFELTPKEQYIKGKVKFHIIALQNISSLTFDLDQNLRIDSIINNNESLQFNRSLNKVSLQLPSVHQNQDRFNFEVYYQGEPIQNGFGSFTTTQRKSGAFELFTLSEPYGAKDWWPCKQSLMDKVDSIDITITCPKEYKSATNGLLYSEFVEDNSRTMIWKHRYPITTYLVGVAVTDYTRYSEYWKYNKSDSMEILNFVYPETLADSKARTPITIEMLELFSNLFTPYPFIKERYGHAQFSWGGGMEHQTMSFMYNFGFGLTAHELAHQWFGNYITLGTWKDIWLNEGFATYLTGLAYEHIQPQYFHQFKKVYLENAVSKPDGSILVNDTTNEARIFSSRLSYAKPALMLHMLRWEIGDSLFFKSIKNYLHDDKLAFAFAKHKDLVQHFENTADTTLTAFFDQWYRGEGYPIYSTSWQQKNGLVRLNIKQRASHPSVSFYKMHIPISVYCKGKETQLRFHNTYNNQEFNFAFEEKIDSIIFDPHLWLVCKKESPLYSKYSHQAQFSIYPNPADQYLNLESIGFRASHYRIINSTGQTIKVGQIINNQHHIATTSLNEGVYFLHIEGNTQNTIKKFQIVH